jgi:hypothetical protein
VAQPPASFDGQPGFSLMTLRRAGFSYEMQSMDDQQPAVEQPTVWRYLWSEAAILALITALIYYAAYQFETAMLIANGISLQLAIVTKESMLLGVAPIVLLGVVLYFSVTLDRVDSAQLARAGVGIFLLSCWLLMVLAAYLMRGLVWALVVLAGLIALEVRAYRKLGREGRVAKFDNLMTTLGAQVHPSVRVTWMIVLSGALALPFACFFWGILSLPHNLCR